MNEDLNSLYTSVSNANFDIGSFEEFSVKMRTPEQRKRFYDAMAAQNVDLGDYNSYESRLKPADFADDLEPEVTTPEVKEATPPADVPVEGKNTASNGADDSSVTPEDELFVGGVLPEVKVEKKKEDKFNPFGFLNFEDKEQFDKNSKDFFNQDEEQAKTQLKKILGENYIIKESGVTFKEFFTPKGKSKSLDQLKIRHKDADKKDFVKIDFNIGTQTGTEEVKEGMYNKSTQDLFDYVNKTMSKEDLSDLQLQQGEVLKKYNALNAPAIIEEDGSVVKQAGPLHVSQEEKDKITSELDAEDLFTPITKKVNISKDPKYSQIIDRTEQPYEEELNKAKQDLISSGVESPTKEQIEDRVRYTIKEQRIQDVYDQKATDYMNSDEVEETDLDALLKLGGFLNKKINFETKKRISQNEIKLKNHIVSIEKDQNDKNTDVGLANEFIKITNSTEPTEFEVGDAKNLVTLQNGTVMPKSTYDKYVVAVNSSQQKYDEIFKLQDKLALDVKDIKDEDVKYDLVKRNYSDAEKFFSTIGVGFQDIAMKAAYGSSKLQSGLFGIDNKHVDEEFIKVQEASEVYRNKFQKDIKFENAFNKKNIGRFLLQEVQNQAPIFATIATGPVGISILGLSSSGENWSRIVEEDKLYGDETSLLNKMFTSAGYGAAEVVFDRYLTLPVMQRSGKALFGSMKKLREVTKPGMMKYAKEFGKRQLIYDPALEISSEGLTTLIQNMITGRPLTENLAHSLFSGGLFGTAFGHTPFYKGLVMQKFSDYNSYSGYRTNLNKVAGLQVTAKKLNTSLKANRTKGNDTSAIEGNIETVNQEIKSLNQENEGILKTIDKKTNNLSKKWFNIYNDATVEQEQIRIDVENISKDESLNNIEKKNLIEIKQDRFDALQETRDVLRDDKNFGNAYAAFRNSNTKEDQDRLQEISGQSYVRVN